MAYSSRSTMLPGAGLRQPSQPSSALATRIAAKKAELDNLRQLRDLKWDVGHANASPRDGSPTESTGPETDESPSRLPATLVRIPAEHRDKTGE
ncbi:DASH complex subunit DAD2 [Penicillium maclennaniae]|uniref:DASH complex subunit DAD2 n=1 Tax=Penicillium maclennaniae TaxID=1343394 RepID=UPI002541B18A|nr:DASH complex subunit DAD2 [Penicillium maclennaniae]KAJ5684817.1 DASH complex subunit DAD2 [Penicillium maclennaniae]